MKKLLTLLLIAVMCLGAVACGTDTENNNKTNINETNNTAELVIDERGYVDFTEEQIAGYLERVELTFDNWQLYFGDYCHETVTKNSFGEITDKTYDHGFGLKEGIIASCHSVAFKFSGKTVYPYVAKDNIPHEQYDYKNNIKRDYFKEDGSYNEYTENFENDYCVVDFKNSSVLIGSNPYHYSGFECIDITGEIYVYNFPENIKENMKGFTINGNPKGDWYIDTWPAPDGDYIANLYNQYHK